MSTQPLQASLLRAGHRNHYLFSDYYLDQRAPERQGWRDADVGATLDALRARWRRGRGNNHRQRKLVYVQGY